MLHSLFSNCEVDLNNQEKYNSYVTEKFPALPSHHFENHYVIVLDLTSLQDAGRNINYPEHSGASNEKEIFFDCRLNKFVGNNCYRRENIPSLNSSVLDEC